MNNIQEQRAALMATLADMLDGFVSSISIDAQLVRPAAGKVAVFIEPPTVEWPSWGPARTGLDVGRHRRHAGHAAIRSR